MASLLSNGRCYSHVADGIATFCVDLFQLRFWDVKQNLIPYAYVLVEGWTIQPYVYCFFDSSDQVLVLPSHYTEVINGGTMTSDVKMVICWGWGIQVLPEPLSKCSWWLPYILIITLHPIAFVSVDYATLCDGILSLGAIRRLLMVLPPLKYTSTQCFLHTFFRLSLIPLTYGAIT